MGNPIVGANAQVMCMHGAPAKSIRPNPRVTVGGVPVLTFLPAMMVSGCPNMTQSVPPAPFPCVTGLWDASAVSQKVTVEGDPVVLSNSTAKCLPTNLGVSIVPGQMRVMAT